MLYLNWLAKWLLWQHLRNHGVLLLSNAIEFDNKNELAATIA